MKNYHNLVAKVLKHGDLRGDRTHTGTRSVFCPEKLRFDLQDGFPLLTTMKGFIYTPKGVAEAQDAWYAAFPDQRIGSIKELTDGFASAFGGVFIFCFEKFEKALLMQGLMSEGESINDAIARFTPKQQEVIEHFLNPDIPE